MQSPSWYIPIYQTVMASEAEPPFVSAAENKGWLHNHPSEPSLAGDPDPPLRSGRHDISSGNFDYTNPEITLTTQSKPPSIRIKLRRRWPRLRR